MFKNIQKQLMLIVTRDKKCSLAFLSSLNYLGNKQLVNLYKKCFTKFNNLL